MVNYSDLSLKFSIEKENYPFKFTYENIYTVLMDAIISSALLPGDILSDSQLSNYFHTSRTPVRQALQYMENLNLLTQSSKGKYIISHIKWDEVRHVSYARQAIESTAAQILAQNLTFEKYYKLKIQLDLIEKSIDNKELWHIDELINLEYNFHNTIVQLSENTILIDLYKSIKIPFIRSLRFFCYENMKLSNSTCQKSDLSVLNFYNLHAAIMTTIGLQNPKRSHDIVHEHLDLLVNLIP